MKMENIKKERLTLLQYVLLRLHEVMENNTVEYIEMISFVRFLFTSQGIEDLLYVDFEAKFPEACHNPVDIINFIETRTNKKQVRNCFLSSKIIEDNYNKKPNRDTYSDIDLDDYEVSQRMCEFPFHM